MGARPFDGVHALERIAVAVSGGPDSLALLKVLSEWSMRVEGPDIYALSVDHGLRPESAVEAEGIYDVVAGWPKVSHSVLKWLGDKPENSIQEEARNARYGLMSQYCQEHEIEHLFLAHHGDDQVETLLFRLAKGSGLDGLSAMREMQKRGDLVLYRPLLGFSKEDLVAYCCENFIDFIDDPFNQKDDFARVRIRKTLAMMEKEGFSLKRASKTAQRLSRAREALDVIAIESYDKALSNSNSIRIEFEFDAMHSLPDEIVLRIIQKAMANLMQYTGYGPRTEKLEALVSDIITQEDFTKRTLGGVVFFFCADKSHLVLEKESLERQNL